MSQAQKVTEGHLYWRFRPMSVSLWFYCFMEHKQQQQGVWHLDDTPPQFSLTPVSQCVCVQCVWVRVFNCISVLSMCRLKLTDGWRRGGVMWAESHSALNVCVCVYVHVEQPAGGGYSSYKEEVLCHTADLGSYSAQGPPHLQQSDLMCFFWMLLSDVTC